MKGKTTQVDQKDTTILREQLQYIGLPIADIENDDIRMFDCETLAEFILDYGQEIAREAELNNMKALKTYMVGGSATFVDWVNYLDERIAELTHKPEEEKV